MNWQRVCAQLGVVVVCWLSTALAAISIDPACLDAGFAATLKCSTCDDLPRFKLASIYDQCTACCQPDQTNGVKVELFPRFSKNKLLTQKYPFAHLEVCNCNLGRYPQVQAFMKDVAPTLSGLSVHHVRGVLPTIKLLSDNGDVQETLNVEKWDTDTIREFLQMHLM